MNIRNYNPHDKTAVLKLLELNTPEFFDESEKPQLVSYLEKEIEDYYVILKNDKIIGAGGINYFNSKNHARLAWDVIHPQFHGQGFGTALAKYRLSRIQENSDVDYIIVRTSQLVYKFYEKLDFIIAKIEKNYWSKGFDLYEMKLQIN